MNQENLTVELVEALQTMLLKGKAISPIVEKLRWASLPGLLEFGCLRFVFRNAIPELPNAIHSSKVWQALRCIDSELGLPSDGSRKLVPKDVSPRTVEFMTVWDEQDTVEAAWENYLHRFERVTKSIGFSDCAALNLQSALHEMATNAAIHSRSTVPALVGYAVYGTCAMFSVVDVGQGVVASLTNNPKYSSLVQPVDAIQEALKTGVTCRVDDNGGFGFSTIFKAVAESWGQLRFRSGNGCITMDGRDLDVDRSVRQFPPPLPGFQISVCAQVDGVSSTSF